MHEHKAAQAFWCWILSTSQAFTLWSEITRLHYKQAPLQYSMNTELTLSKLKSASLLETGFCQEPQTREIRSEFRVPKLILGFMLQIMSTKKLPKKNLDTELVSSTEIVCITAFLSCNFSMVKTHQTLDPLAQTEFTATSVITSLRSNQ